MLNVSEGERHTELGKEKAAKVMRRVWPQLERKPEEKKQGKDGVSASNRPVFYPGLIPTATVYSAQKHLVILSFVYRRFYTSAGE